MCATTRRSVCHASNAFVPGKVLWQLLGAPQTRPPSTSSRRGAATATAESYTSDSTCGQGKEVVESAETPATDPSNSPDGDSNVSNPAPSSPKRRKRRPTLRIPELKNAFPSRLQLKKQMWFVTSEETLSERLRKHVALRAWHMDYLRTAQSEEGTPLTAGVSSEERASLTGGVGSKEGASLTASMGSEEDVSTKEEPQQLSEYVGQVIPSPLSTGSPPDARRIWGSLVGIPRPEQPEMNSHSRLSLDMHKFAQFMREDTFRSPAREAAISEFKAIAKKWSPKDSFEVFGSSKTGLSFVISDVDLRLKHYSLARFQKTHLPPPPEVRLKLYFALRRLYRNLYKYAHVDPNSKFMLVRFRHARYPLISMLHKESGFEFQIVCSNDFKLQEKYIKKYQREYPALVDTFTVIRVTLDVRGLVDVFRGGLGSYSTFMFIVAALKIQEKRGGVVRKDDPANLLQHFLEFCVTFDPYKYGISVDPPELFRKKTAEEVENKSVVSEKAKRTTRLRSQSMEEETPSNEDEIQASAGARRTDPKDAEEASTARPKPNRGRREKSSFRKIRTINEKQPYLLSLVDPADNTNDLGRKCTSIKHILTTFTYLLHRLQSRMLHFDLATASVIEKVAERRKFAEHVYNQYLTRGDGTILKPNYEWPGGKPPMFTQRLTRRINNLTSVLTEFVSASVALYQGRREMMRKYAMSLPSWVSDEVNGLAEAQQAGQQPEAAETEAGGKDDLKKASDGQASKALVSKRAETQLEVERRKLQKMIMDLKSEIGRESASLRAKSELDTSRPKSDII